jgi:branched-chain amino acid transport system substrate-binding protein
MTFPPMKRPVMKAFVSLLTASVLCLTPLTAHAQQSVRIGISAPLTGLGAANGKDLENGVRLALEEANAQHISIGGQPVQFELASVDDQGDPRIGVQVAQKLVDDGVVAVVGYYNSGVALPSSPIFARAGIPLIDPAATNPAITRQGLDNIFRIIATDTQNSGNAGNYAVKVTKAKRIAVMDDRTAFGQGAVEEFKKAVQAAGGQVVSEEFTTDKAVEFNAQLTNIKAANADLLYFGGLDGQAGLLVKRMTQLGIRAQFVGSGGIADSVFISSAGTAADRAMAWEYGRPVDSLPEGRAFAAKFKKRFGADTLTYAPFAYDCAWLAVTAMKHGEFDAARRVHENAAHDSIRRHHRTYLVRQVRRPKESDLDVVPGQVDEVDTGDDYRRGKIKAVFLNGWRGLRRRAALECAYTGGGNPVCWFRAIGPGAFHARFSTVHRPTTTRQALGRAKAPILVVRHRAGRSDRNVKLDPFVTHTKLLSAINEAFELMREGDSIRAVVGY